MMANSKKQINDNIEEQTFIFEENFLEQLVGKKMLTNPLVAVIELVANCWDAGASHVNITWGDSDNPQIIIEDNGEGMTKEEFLHRWTTLSYNRIKEQGETVKISNYNDLPSRRVYGKNGIGRIAAFCFNDNYKVETSKNDKKSIFQITRLLNDTKPYKTELIEELVSFNNGTKIIINNNKLLQCSEESLRSEIAMRFLGDPHFKILINKKLVKFIDIPDKNIETITKDLDSVGKVIFKIINTSFSDRTMKMHGIAFRVNGRLIGDITWKHKGLADTIDGRRLEGKRLLVIVEANSLIDSGIIKSDWSGFNEDDQKYQDLIGCVRETINEFLEDYFKLENDNIYRDAYSKSKSYFKSISLQQKYVWKQFVKEVLKTCRSINKSEVIKLAELLAKLDAATSKYSLINQLADQSIKDLDNLHELFTNWTVQTAKSALDEIKTRMEILETLKIKTADNNVAEVQELQPLFDTCLWVFGPEFESIHYTSNQTMNSVIHKLFKDSTISGSANRPDFVILPDGSVGCHTMPHFGRLGDGDSGEIGVSRLVIVELKKPNVTIGNTEKSQCWKYVKELKKKGCITESTQVDCFLLGKLIETGEDSVTNHGNNCQIIPFLYDTVVRRAQSKLFYLDNKIKSAPFIQELLENEQNEEISFEKIASS